MKPQLMKQPDITFGPAPGDEKTVGSLDCLIVEQPSGDFSCVSVWKPTAEEIKLLSEGGHIVVSIPSYPPPPVAVYCDDLSGILKDDQ